MSMNDTIHQAIHSLLIQIQFSGIYRRTVQSLHNAMLVVHMNGPCFGFGLILYVPVNSCGHVKMVVSPNHIFSWASLTKQLSSTSCTYFLL